MPYLLYFTISMSSCGVTYVAMTLRAAMTMVAGTEAGLRRGELQGAQASLQTVASILAPLGWSKLYELGAIRGDPGKFYLLAAGFQLAKLMLSVCCTVG